MDKLNRYFDNAEAWVLDWITNRNGMIILWALLVLYIAFFMWLGFEETISRSQRMAASQHAW